MEATTTRCSSIPSAHAAWTEEVGVRFVNPPAVTDDIHPEFGPRPLCQECADR